MYVISYYFGYIIGVFYWLHMGNLNLLKSSKSLRGQINVGITVDELMSYKGKRAIVPFEDRIEILRSLKDVYGALLQYVIFKPVDGLDYVKWADGDEPASGVRGNQDVPRHIRAGMSARAARLWMTQEERG